MLKIQLNRYPILTDPLINSKGQFQGQLTLENSFTLNYFRNESFIKFDKEENAWFLDLSSIVTSITPTPGPPGPQGPQGVQGPQGIQGPVGPAGDASVLFNVVYETIDGNETPALASGINEILRRNLDDTGYEFVNFSQIASDIEFNQNNIGFNQF